MLTVITPHLFLANVRELDASRLRLLGVDGLLLDLDGTLKDYRAEEIPDLVKDWVAGLLEESGVFARGSDRGANAPQRRAVGCARGYSGQVGRARETRSSQHSKMIRDRGEAFRPRSISSSAGSSRGSFSRLTSRSGIAVCGTD